MEASKVIYIQQKRTPTRVFNPKDQSQARLRIARLNVRIAMLKFKPLREEIRREFVALNEAYSSKRRLRQVSEDLSIRVSKLAVAIYVMYNLDAIGRHLTSSSLLAFTDLVSVAPTLFDEYFKLDPSKIYSIYSNIYPNLSSCARNCGLGEILPNARDVVLACNQSLADKFDQSRLGKGS